MTLTAAVEREKAKRARDLEKAVARDRKTKIADGKKSFRWGFGVAPDEVLYERGAAANGRAVAVKDGLRFRIVVGMSNRGWNLFRTCEHCGNEYDAGFVAPDADRYKGSNLNLYATPAIRRKKAVENLTSVLGERGKRQHTCMPGASARLLEVATSEAARLKTTPRDLLYATAEHARGVW